MAEIGIILAAYNGEKYLREQLDSILSNTFKDYEIHICDDGSTDGTIAIAKEYADDEDAFSKKIYDVIGAGVGIIESVPAAVSIAYYTQDPNKCCLMCANLGGDTDTIGAMATAICGAFVGYSKINPEYTELLRVQNPETDFEEYINILEKGRELLGCGR